MKIENMRFMALSIIIDGVENAECFGDKWYQFSSSFFSMLMAYRSVEIISEDEYDFIFDSMNHCYFSECNDILPYLYDLQSDARKSAFFA